MVSPAIVFQSVDWAPFGQDAVLRGLALEVRPGEAVAVTGPLGSGKTAVLRLAAGLDHPNAGSVRVLGLDPTQPRTRRALGARLGWVPRQGHLLSNLSLWDNLVLPLRWHRDPAQAEVEHLAQQALKRFGIRSLPPVLPARAPAAMCRLVALARAFADEPAVVLCDEPTAELDQGSATELWAHLARLAAEMGVALLAAAAHPPPVAGLRVVQLPARAAANTRRWSLTSATTATYDDLPRHP